MKAEVRIQPVDPDNAARSEPSTIITLCPEDMKEVGCLRWALQTKQFRATFHEVASGLGLQYVVMLHTEKSYQEREQWGQNTDNTIAGVLKE